MKKKKKILKNNDKQSENKIERGRKKNVDRIVYIQFIFFMCSFAVT